MEVRWWKTAEKQVAEFKANRAPQSDADFLAACDLPQTDYACRVATAVRRSVATYGMCDARYIYAEDRYPAQLGVLSGWDSLDFLGWTLELEKELSRIVPRDTWSTLSGTGFSVRELIQAVLDRGELEPIGR